MCGITGLFSFDNTSVINEGLINDATSILSSRGPDNQGVFIHKNIGLGHRRLSIQDTSEASNQPFHDPTGRYTIVFNGEIYNFKALRNDLENKGIDFKTTGDTEVLLQAYILYKEKCLALLNGFFAFAIYDKKENTLFIARDRLGIKPLLYFNTEHLFGFASEMKALLKFPIKREIDYESLAIYFQLNYIPAPYSIYKSVYKVLPGHYLKINGDTKEVTTKQYYHVPVSYERSDLTYKEQQQNLINLLDLSVQSRMISDVPLGAFLSGGIDSSVIVSLASKHTNQLNTFSIGFKENAFFDETSYANLVAKKFNTNHTTFKLSNDDLFNSLKKILEYTDEPFADSSAILVNILSQKTREHVTVALSGDGGDELFAGYNKHYAEWRIRNKGLKERLVKVGHPLWAALPKSRHSKYGNLFRQLERFAIGSKLSHKERYWRWCAFINEEEINKYFSSNFFSPEVYEERKAHLTKHINNKGTINDCLYNDVHLILPNDMLTKVDTMSMANALEVRVPFLDHQIVEYAFSLPISSKINGNFKKKIVQDAFKHILPKELYNRPKRGFEVPLLQWIKTGLNSLIFDDLLDKKFIKEQNIFNIEYIELLKQKAFSKNPGDVHAQIWALAIFQNWYKKFHLS